MASTSKPKHGSLSASFLNRDRPANSYTNHFLDKVMDDVFSTISISTTSTLSPEVKKQRLQDRKSQPELSVGTIARNFRDLNARLGLMFDLQYLATKVFKWENPFKTFSMLIIYTLICFHPHLLAIIPSALFLLFVMVPAYNFKHPVSEACNIPVPWYKVRRTLEFDLFQDDETVVKREQLKKASTQDILSNVRDLQNLMSGFIDFYDTVALLIYSSASFVDESYSTMLYIIILLTMIPLSIIASMIPWNLAFAFTGWLVMLLCHPSIQITLKRNQKIYLKKKEESVGTAFQKGSLFDIITEEGKIEEREVEIFELQRQGLTPRIWEPWVFTNVIYDLESSWHKSQLRPPGSRFLSDVLPPNNSIDGSGSWYFQDNESWLVDHNTKKWVLDLGITDVEIDLENHWAYDYKNGIRGEWRRRRLTRKCYRNPPVPNPPSLRNVQK
ncbi:integral peroxisomal membrane peroxin [Nadsonia fulvescens var. elongata DSM 6958]|uniref:Integral peroxisomal membrane peroxin n=1 Tax=Nadsonia fulvescens var. elongata DSM 6958 TaxID=857566 RepID=A0A1E3PSU3_9ASCO|nr:integral peroxisomal membrane peroxin [Nadsonia fulvescens var. elongata DSM 6958]